MFIGRRGKPVAQAPPDAAAGGPGAGAAAAGPAGGHGFGALRRLAALWGPFGPLQGAFGPGWGWLLSQADAMGACGTPDSPALQVKA